VPTGGDGIVRGHPGEQIFRECKTLSIGDGSMQVMKDLAPPSNLAFKALRRPLTPRPHGL
jgi:hypothetical protein